MNDTAVPTADASPDDILAFVTEPNQLYDSFAEMGDDTPPARAHAVFGYDDATVLHAAVDALRAGADNIDELGNHAHPRIEESVQGAATDGVRDIDAPDVHARQARRIVSAAVRENDTSTMKADRADRLREHADRLEAFAARHADAADETEAAEHVRELANGNFEFEHAGVSIPFDSVIESRAGFRFVSDGHAIATARKEEIPEAATAELSAIA